MCRSIKPLFNIDPPATDDEIIEAARQYVRKVAGSPRPSEANTAAYERAIAEVAATTRDLLAALTTRAAPRDRAVAAERAKRENARRFNVKTGVS